MGSLDLILSQLKSEEELREFLKNKKGRLLITKQLINEARDFLRSKNFNNSEILSTLTKAEVILEGYANDIWIDL